MTFAKTVVLTVIAAGGLCGCIVSQPRLSDDFGAAVHQDMVAQITDPSAGGRRRPPPTADGARVALAQDRYRTGQVIAPSGTASTIGGSNTNTAPPPAPAAAAPPSQ